MKDLQQKKIRKFWRDTINYQENKVYPWLNRGGISTKPSRKVHFQEEISHTSASSGDSDADFLTDHLRDTIIEKLHVITNLFDLEMFL